MDRLRVILPVATILAFIPLLAARGQDSGTSALPSAEIVTILPEETDELLANPGIGWETFGRTQDKDKSLPAWIPSTVHYDRWGWGVLEPRPGEIDYAFLDKVLAESHAAGQRLAFRVMCCSTYLGRPYHPDWLDKAGGKVLTVDYEGREGFLIPDLDDVDTLARHLRLIARLGARYDGHPDLDHVDLGLRRLVGRVAHERLEDRQDADDGDAQADHRHLPERLSQDPPAHADRRPRMPHLRRQARDRLAGRLSRGHGRVLEELVPHAGRLSPPGPGRGESTTPGRRLRWPGRPAGTCVTGSKRTGRCGTFFNYALALHGSYINNKSAPLPPDEATRPEIERFLRRLGYRFVLTEMKHPKQAAVGTKLTIDTKWRNVGSAPCYRPYRVAYKLSNGQGYSKVLPGTNTVNKWMPGSVALFTKEFFQQVPDLPPGEVVPVTDKLALPEDMPKGEYDLALGIVEENSTEPVVRLAIKGRTADGWYPLGKLIIH